MRRAFLAVISFAIAAVGSINASAKEHPRPASEGSHTIEFEGKRWVTDLADHVTVEQHQGKRALRVRGRTDSYVYLPHVEFRDGTIEVDIATGSRAIPGIGFHGRASGQWADRVMLNRWRRASLAGAAVIEQAVLTRREGTLLFLQVGVPGKDDSGADRDSHGWFHLKVVVRGRRLAVYLDHEAQPSIEVDEMLDVIGPGTLGVCGRNSYFANFRYTPFE
jgi:hypothetical protein